MNSELLNNAMEWAKENHPNASLQHKAAFANSVAYLCSGWSSGYGGPSLREHLCSWMLTGPEGTNVGAFQFRDGRLPTPGSWEFDNAVKFCAPLCFEPAQNYLEKLLQIMEHEHCFDDDPTDLEVVQGK